MAFQLLALPTIVEYLILITRDHSPRASDKFNPHAAASTSLAPHPPPHSLWPIPTSRSMDAVNLPGTDLDDIIGKIEGLLGRLKHARESSRSGRAIGSIAQAPARTDTGPGVQIISSPSALDPILYTLTSIIKEATHLLKSQNSAAISQVRPLSALSPTTTSAPSSAPSSTEQGSPSSSTSPPASASRPVEDPSVAIDYQFDSSVLVLRPSVDEWLDFPSILASAKALNAHAIGAFKVVVPAGLHHPLPSREVTGRQRCWGYRANALPNKTYEIEMPAKRQVFRQSLPCSLSALEAMKRHEMILKTENGLDGVYYRTDIPAETPQQRAATWLPEESMIWPLKGNMLSETKFSIPGLHWPYAYESGSEFGASFQDHVEHLGLYSISHLHAGRKLWRIVTPSAADAFVTNLKETNSEIFWECEQCVRHAGIFVPLSTLEEWGIPFTILDQKAGEIIITMPWAYHAGFSCGYTLAEAVNYADADWTSHDHSACLPSCPEAPISIDLLAFRAPEEDQQRVEDFEREQDAKERKAKQQREKRSIEEHGRESQGSVPLPVRNTRRPLHVLPTLSPEPAEQIPQMINYILSQQFPRRWLDCAEHDEAFRGRLEQFLPGGWLDSPLLMKMLRIISSGSRIIVQDTENIEPLNAKVQDWLRTYDALVLPVHVGDTWTLLVVDWMNGKSTSVGMAQQQAEYWNTRFSGLAKAELQHNIQEVSCIAFIRWGIY